MLQAQSRVHLFNVGIACSERASNELTILLMGVLRKLTALPHPEAVLKSRESLAIRILTVAAWMQLQPALQLSYQLNLCGHPDTESPRVPWRPVGLS
ncbi:MAG: hypothetical protein IPL70_15645 [Uliginosibacterium sp.]|nr:hypothetical protein [Uliginosibacterium sp.]